MFLEFKVKIYNNIESFSVWNPLEILKDTFYTATTNTHSLLMRLSCLRPPEKPFSPNTGLPLPYNDYIHFRHDSSSCLIPPAAIWFSWWKRWDMCLCWLLGRWPITVDWNQPQMTMTSAALRIISFLQSAWPAVWPTERLKPITPVEKFISRLVMTSLVWMTCSVNKDYEIIKVGFKCVHCIIVPFVFAKAPNISSVSEDPGIYM